MTESGDSERAREGARARHALVREAFLRCRPLRGPARGAVLDEIGARDPLLRSEVEELLNAAESDANDALADARVEGREPLAPWVPVHAPADPERIAEFRIVRRIGEGGMGVVYEAEQAAPRRRVALKLVRAGLAHGVRLRRFRLEAEALGRLQHPGIAQIFGFGTADFGRGEQPYFVMDLVEGVPLLVHAERAKLDRRARLALVAELCDAVQHAHERGVVHRDLKPDNVLVNAEGRAKVLDFGVARVRSNEAELATVHTEHGELVGTLTHMAPEQLAGDADSVGPPADVYALGVIAFELLTGRLPHDVAGLPISSAIRHITEIEAPRLGSLDSTLRGDVDTIVAKALSQEPARRYVSAAALAADIRRFLEHRPIAARRPSVAYRCARFARRNRGLVAGLAVALLVAIAGIWGVIGFARREAAARVEAEIFGLDTLAASYDAIDDQLAREEVWRARERLDSVSADRRSWEWRWLDARAPLMLDGLHARYASIDGRFVAATTQTDESAPAGVQIRARSLVVVDLADPGGPRRTVEGLVGASLVKGAQPCVALTYAPAATGWTRSRHQCAAAIVDVARATVDELVRVDAPARDESESESVQFMLDGELLATIHSVHEHAKPARNDWIELSTRAERAAGFARRFTVDYPLVRDVFALDDPGLVVVGLWGADPPALVIDTDGWKELARYGDEPLSVTIDRERKRLACLSSSGVLEILALPSLQRVQSFAVPRGEVGPLFWVRDDAWLVSNAGPTLFVLDARSGEMVETADTSSIRRITAVDERGRFAVSYGGATERPWVLELGAPPAAQYIELSGHSEWIYAVAYSPDGSLIASAAPNDPLLRLWDGWTGESVATLPRALAQPETFANYPAPLAFTADGSGLVTTEPTERGVTVVTYDLARGDVRRSAGHRSFGDWPAAPGEMLRELIEAVGDVRGRVLGARLVGGVSGRELYCAPLFSELGSTDELVVRSASDGSRLSSRGPCLGIALSPDGEQLAVGDYGSVRITHARSGRTLATLLEEPQAVKYYAIAWSPDGARIAVGDSNGRVRIVETRRHRTVLELPRHGDYVHALAWSPDGTRLVSASGDKTLRLYDTLHAIPRRLRAEQRTSAAADASARLETFVRELGDERAAIEALVEQAGDDEARSAARRACLLRAHRPARK